MCLHHVGIAIKQIPARTKLLLGMALSIMVLMAGACSDSAPKTSIPGIITSDGTEHSIPIPPDIPEPKPPSLPTQLKDTFRDETISIDVDTDSTKFENCLITIKIPEISITRSEFINSRIFIESVSDVVLSGCIVRDYPVHEEPAVNVYDSHDILFEHNYMTNNSIGISVTESHDIVFESNIFKNNYQHNAIAAYKSSCEIAGNFFEYNFPHGVLIHFIPDHGSTAILIHDNIFNMNIEDAINFEDWSGAKDESVISNNIITKTNWAGINIEYNSWDAKIRIENNYISESGYPIKEFPNSPVSDEEWNQGWEHGVKLEDCSGVTLIGNTILDNNKHGIDIKNSRNITLNGNTISRNSIGIFVGGPDPYSYTRDVSPLSQANAGMSSVIFIDNYLCENDEDIVQETIE